MKENLKKEYFAPMVEILNARVERGSEGYYEDLLLADAVGIAGIVQAGVAGLIVFLVLFLGNCMH